ncbi:MAG: Alpha,3/4-fucosidase [Microbacterium sp.]|jgi:alpha-L-fucosidase|nr:Alpha,3/4-fucosidase [Microbacterium sp.]
MTASSGRADAAPAAEAARIAEAVAVVPSPRQLAWQRTEFYGFIHFGVNTMTDREWGLGHEDPAIFDPASLDAGQWARAMKDAGMRGVILTCKHHDGFALWPSAVSSHTVAASPWRGGRGDLVAEVAAACREHGLKFGVYLSPWDRTERSYGSGEAYDDFFVAQLTELLTGYGEIFSVWFDGANGEGPNGRTQYYDWDRYYEVVRRLQPDAAISVCGPDVRWCGNEAGQTRVDEWSVVPRSLQDAERTADRSQKVDDGAFSRAVRSDENDLGSRAALLATDEPLVWYPAEVNTSIRPGWFHHPAEDDQVRTPHELFEIYRRSVGGNATFLLNLPPNRDGLLSAPDVASLRELGELIRGLRTRDIARDAELSFTSAPVASASLTDLDPATGVWSPQLGDDRPGVTLRWPAPRELAGVVVREDIARGQLVERVEVYAADEGGESRLVGAADSVGYERIIDLDDVTTDRLTLVFSRSRATPMIAGVHVVAVA